MMSTKKAMAPTVLSVLPPSSAYSLQSRRSVPPSLSLDTNGQTIVVGSANFSENILLGEMYAKALDNQGFNVDRKLNNGAREVLYSQVENCTLVVVSEYNQTLLAFIAPDEVVSGTAEVDAAVTHKTFPNPDSSSSGMNTIPSVSSAVRSFYCCGSLNWRLPSSKSLMRSLPVPLFVLKCFANTWKRIRAAGA
ncbi:hypothetical protein OK351_17740 [Glutamicibacter sp. MNS18]|uniref:glycine betaine ABC transporter substrate-binding protein n=1 Tax=Glutamicibacter sp. MNS18 TaxID=2989817 RepID=UPI0022355012|nr:glycine betaine ABC transporter substrate-binding protein [Glutamicibacter sp. MNS18]MCW4467322.1 hypothetical protein [Glutamicibacter sp. MNS18]